MSQNQRHIYIKILLKIKKSKGIAFIEFLDPEDALKFMEYFSQKPNYSKFNKNKIPIIEFSIEDIRKTKKIEKIISSKKEKKKIEKKDEKTRLETNKKTHTYKILIEELMDKKDVNSLESIKKYLKNIKSRGIKQRLKKKIELMFGVKLEKEKKSLKPDEKKKIIKKKEQISTENKEINKKMNNNNEKSEIFDKNEIQKIVKNQKNKAKLKRKAEDNDELDVKN